MPKAHPIQAAFNAGELSPRLEGRIDLAKYAAGGFKFQNFLPLVQGGALKRSGTRFVKETKDSSQASRLIPFEFSTTQAYILEFGNLYMRVYRDNGVVLEPNLTISDVANTTPIRITTSTAHSYSTGDQVFIAGTGISAIDNKFFLITVFDADEFDLDGTTASGASAAGTSGRVFTLTTTYTAAQVGALAYAQSADVLYIASPDHAPRKLSRTDHHVWTIEDLNFGATTRGTNVPPFQPENVEQGFLIGAQLQSVDSTDVVITMGDRDNTKQTGIFKSGHVGGFIKIREALVSFEGKWKAENDMLAYKGTFGVGDRTHNSRGWVYELMDKQSSTITGTQEPMHTEKLEIATDGKWLWRFTHYGYGYVEITEFVDKNRVKGTIRVTLPRSDFRDTITNITEAAGTSTVTTSAAHGFDADDEVYINDVVGSVEVNDKTFKVLTVPTTTTFTISTGTISAYVSDGTAQKLFTPNWSLGAWSAEAGFPRAVTFFEDRLWFAGSKANPQTAWASRTGIYEDHRIDDLDTSALVWTLNTDQVNVIEWLSPAKVLRLGTAGGEFVLQASRDTEPLTPTNIRIDRHTSYGSRPSVRPISVEQVLLFVQRAGRKLRELVFDFDSDSFVAPDMTVLSDHIAINQIKEMAFEQEPNRLLWCVLEDGNLICFTYERAQQVTAWHNHKIGGTGVSVESVAVVPHPDGDRDQTWFVIKRTINGGTKRYIEYMEEDWLRTNSINDAFFVDSGLNYDGAPATTISGLDHLEGETVRVLGDGKTLPDEVVSSGQIVLADPVSKASIGLGYDATLQTMRIEAGAADGTAQAKTKRITNVAFRLDQTGEGLLYGPTDTDADMETLKIEAGTLKDGDTELLPWPEGYEQPGRVTAKHNKPTPCSITAIMPEIVTQDRG